VFESYVSGKSQRVSVESHNNQSFLEAAAHSSTCLYGLK